jgi:hypothetical protein
MYEYVYRAAMLRLKCCNFVSLLNAYILLYFAFMYWNIVHAHVYQRMHAHIYAQRWTRSSLYCTHIHMCTYNTHTFTQTHTHTHIWPVVDKFKAVLLPLILPESADMENGMRVYLLMFWSTYAHTNSYTHSHIHASSYFARGRRHWERNVCVPTHVLKYIYAFIYTLTHTCFRSTFSSLLTWRVACVIYMTICMHAYMYVVYEIWWYDQLFAPGNVYFEVHNIHIHIHIYIHYVCFR